jgi:hypothetical protein
MFFSFVGGVSICPWTALGYVLGGSVGDSCVVHDTQLFTLQIHTSSFGTSWQGKMVQHSKALYGLVVQKFADFDSD